MRYCKTCKVMQIVVSYLWRSANTSICSLEDDAWDIHRVMDHHGSSTLCSFANFGPTWLPKKIHGWSWLASISAVGFKMLEMLKMPPNCFFTFSLSCAESNELCRSDRKMMCNCGRFSREFHLHSDWQRMCSCCSKAQFGMMPVVSWCLEVVVTWYKCNQLYPSSAPCFWYKTLTVTTFDHSWIPTVLDGTSFHWNL